MLAVEAFSSMYIASRGKKSAFPTALIFLSALTILTVQVLYRFPKIFPPLMIEGVLGPTGLDSAAEREIGTLKIA